MLGYGLTAAQKVFGLPELVHQILDYLWEINHFVDQPKYSGGYHVNRLWSRECSSFTWMFCTAKRLMSVANLERRQFLASQICSLQDNTPDIPLDPSLSFPRLQGLSVDSLAFKSEWQPTDELLRTLRNVYLDVTISQQTLYRMAKLCPKFGKIGIERVDFAEDRSEDRMAFEEASTGSFTKLQVDFVDMDEHPEGEVFEKLLQSLQTFFKIGMLIARENKVSLDTAVRLAKAGTAFGDITYLDIGLELEALPILVPHLTRLQHFCLHAHGLDFHKLGAVADIQSLERLEVTFEEDYPVLEEDVLQVLPQLQKLERISFERKTDGHHGDWTVPVLSECQMLQYLARFPVLNDWLLYDHTSYFQRPTANWLTGCWTCEAQEDGEKEWISKW